MPPSLNTLTSSETALFAVLATGAAAIVGAITAVCVAWINSHSARRLARDAATRDYRLIRVEPFLDFLDKRIAWYHELISEGRFISGELEKGFDLIRSGDVEKGKQQIGALDSRYEPIRDKANALFVTVEDLLHSPVLAAILTFDYRVTSKYTKWMAADSVFGQTV